MHGQATCATCATCATPWETKATGSGTASAARAAPSSGAGFAHFGADVLAHNFGADLRNFTALRSGLRWASPPLRASLWALRSGFRQRSCAYIRTLGRQENRWGKPQRQHEVAGVSQRRGAARGYTCGRCKLCHNFQLVMRKLTPRLTLKLSTGLHIDYINRLTTF